MDAVENIFDLLFRDNGERSPDGRCYSFEDGVDGFVIHGDTCKYAGQGAMSSSDCIQLAYWRGIYPAWVDKRRW